MDTEMAAGPNRPSWPGVGRVNGRQTEYRAVRPRYPSAFSDVHCLIQCLERAVHMLLNCLGNGSFIFLVPAYGTRI
jgi:hypothetical protein